VTSAAATTQVAATATTAAAASTVTQVAATAAAAAPAAAAAAAATRVAAATTTAAASATAASEGHRGHREDQRGHEQGAYRCDRRAAQPPTTDLGLAFPRTNHQLDHSATSQYPVTDARGRPDISNYPSNVN
jgi:hypothetical protein